MGCCSSKLPTFPASSAADGIAPTTPPDEFSSQLIKFIPQDGMFGNAIGVFLPNDMDAPTYFFSPAGGSYKMFKTVMEGKEEMAVIKSGWQSSKGYNQTDTMGNEYGNVTTSAKKTLTVVTKLNGMEHKVKIVKTFERASGSKVELNEGYSIQENFNTNGVQPRLELYLDGNVIAHVYERAASMSPDMGGAGMSGAIKNAMAIMKAPMVLYIKRSLSEIEMVRALTIIATANDRLIRTACIEVNAGGVNPNHGGHDMNQHYHDGGGGWGGNDGGDGGGGDYGGGDDGGGGGE